MRFLFAAFYFWAVVAGSNFQDDHRLGEFYAKKGDLKTAVTYLRKAYEADPAQYDNAYDLALALLETGATQESRQVIQALLKQHEKAELHNLLGEVEEKEGHAQQSVGQYETAARMDLSEKNLFDLANELLLHNGAKPALKVLEFATGKYPKSSRLQVALGVAEYSLGRWDQAVDALCHAVDLDPRDTRAFDFLGKMHDISPQKADEVSRRLKEFARRYPDNAAANYYYALSLRQRAIAGNSSAAHDEAEKFLLRATKLQRDWPEPHYQLALLYEDESLADKATREYEATIRLRPAFAKAHYRLARLYERAGKRQMAQAELKAFEALKAKEP
jgi:tetratricopeptide (TPR) repeat protein